MTMFDKLKSLFQSKTRKSSTSDSRPLARIVQSAVPPAKPSFLPTVAAELRPPSPFIEAAGAPSPEPSPDFASAPAVSSPTPTERLLNPAPNSEAPAVAASAPAPEPQVSAESLTVKTDGFPQPVNSQPRTPISNPVATATPPRAAAAKTPAPASTSGKKTPGAVFAPTPEQLCNISPNMTPEQVRQRLAMLYRRYNQAASSLNAGLRTEAEAALDAIVAVREKYFGPV
jgi:hypothetical protein